MNKKNNIFISYSREDKEFVDRLKNDLRQSGFDVWVDIEEILPGQNWQSSIENAISSAFAYIFVASLHSTSRVESYIYKELSLAFNKYKQLSPGIRFVFPIILDNRGAENLPDFLKEFQWCDFRADYQESLKYLLESLPGEIHQKAPVKAKEEKSKGYVFISYADENADFVEKLKSYLAERSYSYWDYEESDRNYHTQLFLELEEAISGAAATLSVLSPAWKKSKWTVKEFFFSEEVGVPVFLLMANEIGPTLAIAGMPYIDFSENEAVGFQKLGRELTKKGL